MPPAIPFSSRLPPVPPTFSVQPGTLYFYLVACWDQWDTVWYQRIAAAGYIAGNGSTWHPPVYAAALHLFGNSMVAALLLSSASAIIAFTLLDLIAQRRGISSAMVGWSLATLPAAWILVSGYTEAPFLALALGSVFAMETGHYRWAMVLGALAALTRWDGVALALPIWLVARQKLDVRRATLVACAPCVAIGVYALAIRAFTGESAFFWQVASTYWQFHSATPWQLLLEQIARLRDGRALTVEWGETAITLVQLALSVVLWRRMPPSDRAYLVATWAIDLTHDAATPFAGMLRYALLRYPLFLAMGTVQSRWTRLAVVGLPFQVVLAAVFTRSWWIG